MTQKGNIIKASKGKMIYRLADPDTHFHGCVMLEGETKDNFGEISEDEARKAEALHTIAEFNA